MATWKATPTFSETHPVEFYQTPRMGHPQLPSPPVSGLNHSSSESSFCLILTRCHRQTLLFMPYCHNPAKQTRFTWAAGSFVGHGSTTDGTAIGSDTPAVSSVTVALNLSETTRTMCSLSDTRLLSHSIHGTWVQKLIQQTVLTKPRAINHNRPISVLYRIF